MRVVLSSHVEHDLEQIADWIAEDNPVRAVSFVRETGNAFRRIGEGPLRYQLRPDIGEDARLAVVDRYIIPFWIDTDVVRIERVVFGGRDLPPLFG